MNPQRVLTVLAPIFAEPHPAPAAGPARDADRTVTAALTAYHRVVAELRLTEDQRRRAPALFLAELERRLPQFLAVVALTSQLPLVGELARNHALGARESRESAEDFGQDVVAQVLHACFGRWPRGNVGAWVAMIRKRMSCDRHRRRAREEKAMEWARERCRDGC